MILSCLKKLETASKDNKNCENIPHILEKLKTELDKDIARRIYAAKQNAYSILLNLMKSNKNNINILKPALKTMTSLMNGHPDLLDMAGIEFQMQ